MTLQWQIVLHTLGILGVVVPTCLEGAWFNTAKMDCIQIHVELLARRNGLESGEGGS